MWQTLAIVVFVAVLIGAFFPRARVRAVAQFFGGAVFVLSALSAVAMVVGGVVLESRGGGVLLLGAVVPGIVAWISGSLFFASRRYGARRRRPVDEQQRETLSDFEATLDGALQRLAALRAERARLSTSAARRAEIARAIAHEQSMLGLLPRLRPALEDLRNYEQEGQAPNA